MITGLPIRAPSCSRRSGGICCAILIALLCFIVKPRSAEAQDQLYSWSMEDEPAAAAFTSLNQVTQVGFLYETAVLENEVVTCTIERANVEAIVACLLDNTGLTYRRLPSGAIVIVDVTEDSVPGGDGLAPTPADPARLTGFVTDVSDGQPLQAATVVLQDLVR